MEATAYQRGLEEASALIKTKCGGDAEVLRRLEQLQRDMERMVAVRIVAI